jgi:non-specific serine/threonine protein kinase
MLETIREFGLELLADRGEHHAVRRRHADWCLDFAEEAGPRAQGAEQEVWLARLDAEQANLRAALAWAIERADAVVAVRLAAALWPYWEERCRYGEGQRWLEAAIALPGDAPARHKALIGAGRMAWHRCDYALAERRQEDALALAREVGDEVAAAFAANNLGVQALERGNFAEAKRRLEASRRAAAAAGSGRLVIYADHNLGDIARLQGDPATAVVHYESGLRLARAGGETWYVPKLLCVLGFAALDLGDDVRSAAILLESLTLARDPLNLWNVTECLEGLARVAMARGRAEDAARLFGAADARHDEMGAPVSPTFGAYVEPTLAAIRDALGEAGFAAAWREGRALSLAAAIAAADRLGLARPTAATATPDRAAVDPFGLTPREREVLRLLAAGEPNRAIADRLFISPATVARHLANLYAKLGVESRVGAVTAARRHGIA